MYNLTKEKSARKIIYGGIIFLLILSINSINISAESSCTSCGNLNMETSEKEAKYRKEAATRKGQAAAAGWRR